MRNYTGLDNGLDRSKHHNNPWKPVLIYMIFGFMWIYFSDRVLSIFVTDHALYEQIQTIKGSLYIFITGVLSYALIRFDNRIIFDLNKELQEKNDELKNQQSLVEEIFQQSNAAILIWQTDGTIVEINDYFTELFGYTEEEILGKNWFELMVPVEHHMRLESLVNELKDKKRSFNVESSIIAKSGEIKQIVWNDALLDSTHNDQLLIASYGFDTTLQKEQAEEIYKLAYVDTLTGLDNRAVYERDIKSLKSTKTPFTIYLIDIDNFKHLNEIHGHEYGDQLLIDYAKTLKSALIHHRVYRWIGNQFLILEETSNAQAVQLTLDNIKSLSHRDWNLSGITFSATVSIGVTCYPNDTERLTDMFKNAEIALYAAKDNGKASYQFYHKRMLEEIEYFNFIEHELTTAMEKDDLELYFQPIHSFDSGDVVYYEVLLRWFNKKLKNTPIGKIIEIAEKTEQIVDIDKWVIHNAFSLIEKEENAFKDLYLSINISAHSFRSEEFIDYLIEEVSTHKISPGRIQLEITEHSIIEDIEYTAGLMHKLKSVGFTLALDDFGTRYSSLNYLSKLPFDTLKVDKSYVDFILIDENDRAIIEMLIHLSEKIGLKVVAEGIEDQAQYDELKRIGCGFGQGYFMSRPHPLSSIQRQS